MKTTVADSTRRFASLINQPGGHTLEEAVTAAQKNLERIREVALHEIETTLEQIQVLGGALNAAPTPPLLRDLYSLSNTIVGVAGVFGLGHVGAVAYSLCELIDRLELSGLYNPAAVQVHLDSLRLMQATSPDDTKRSQAVQRALLRVVNSVQPSARPGD